MKKFLLVLLCVQFLVSGKAKAQTFTATDTVRATIGNESATVNDFITNNMGGDITLRWHVTATNFTSDWLADTAFGICDNNLCRGNGGNLLWPMGTAYLSSPYSPGPGGAFDLSLNFSGAGVGTHYVTINLTDTATPASTRNITFVITKNQHPVAVSNINTAQNEVSLYPNPAHNELNIICGANSDIKTIAVYNIIGKVMMVYKIAGTSANLNLENIPSGIYFVRLTDSNGGIVVTKKFTRQ